MSRETRGKVRSKGPWVRPVEKIELSDRHTGLRLALTAVLLLLGVGALAYGFMLFITPDAEWEKIEVNSAAATNCGGDFTFYYHLGQEDSATAERREIVLSYTEAAVTAYRQFSVDEHFEDMVGLYDVNHAPNREIRVGEVVYAALEELLASGDRTIYLGNAYGLYENVFSAGDDSELAGYDPLTSPDLKEDYGKLAAFARDPAQVDLELLGDGWVVLHVSEEYLQYAHQNGFETYLDFAWMKNAFIIDYLAETLREKGYTYGYLESCDGYLRNLDSRGREEYAYRFYHGEDGKAYAAAETAYQGALSAVNLRAYPLGDRDFRRFYVTETGETRAPYLDLKDGMPRVAVPELTLYSRDPDTGCAALLLRLKPIFVAEDFDPGALVIGDEEGAVWFEDTTLRYTEADLALRNFFESDALSFTAVPVK